MAGMTAIGVEKQIPNSKKSAEIDFASVGFLVVVPAMEFGHAKHKP